MLQCPTGKNVAYHGKTDVGLLESWPIVGAVSRDSYYFSIGTNFAIDDAFDKGELVDRLRPGKDSELGPDLIQLILRYIVIGISDESIELLALQHEEIIT